MFSSVSGTERLDICFDSYRDLCEVLGLDARQSDTEIYRERTERTDFSKFTGYSSPWSRLAHTGRPKNPAGSKLSVSIPNNPVPYLHKERAIWQEGPGRTVYRSVSRNCLLMVILKTPCVPAVRIQHRLEERPQFCTLRKDAVFVSHGKDFLVCHCKLPPIRLYQVFFSPIFLLLFWDLAYSLSLLERNFRPDFMVGIRRSLF